MKKILYYIAIAATVSLQILGSSTLFSIPEAIANIFTGIIAALFTFKILLDQHTARNFLLIVLATIIPVLVYAKTGASFILLGFLAAIGIKDMNIKTILKIVLTINLTALCSHAILFFVDLIFSPELTADFIHNSIKGTSYSLYFSNPNTTGLIATWSMIYLLYLKKNLKFRNIILPTVVTVLVFLITKSRTPFYSYLMFLFLNLIRNEKVLTAIQKIAYPAMAVFSLIVVSLLKMNNPLAILLNESFSGRLGYSMLAVRAAGIHFFPQTLGLDFFSEYIIDNFFVRSFILYGIVTLILFYIPHALLPKTSSKNVKIISIVTSLYLFFETAAANIGFCIPYLIIADGVANRRSEPCEK